MHYTPELRNDVDEEAQTVGSKGSRKSRRSRDTHRRSRRDRTPSSCSQHSQYSDSDIRPKKDNAHHKVQKGLGKLLKRTFAKHKPGPLQLFDTPGGGATPHKTEQHALLPGVINCDYPNHYNSNNKTSPSAASVTLDSPSVLSSSTTPTSAAMSSSLKTYQTCTYPLSPTQSGSSLSPHGRLAADDSKSSTDENDSGASVSSSTSSFDPNETQEARALRIARAQEKIRANMSFSTWHCIVAILLYVLISILCFSFLLEQEWTFLTSSYFAVVTFTTIGYGDVVPSTMDARLFTCFWALSGVACLGIALGVLGSNLIEGAEQDHKEAKVQRQSKVIGLFDQYDTTPTAEKAKNFNMRFSTIDEGKRRVMFDGFDDSDDEGNPRLRVRGQGCQWPWCRLPAAFHRGFVLVLFFVGTLYALSLIEEWDLVTTIYYAIITATTVGYGDFAPKTDTGRALAVIFIPLAVSTTGALLGTIANYFINRRRDQYTTYLENKPLTEHAIHILDSDGDGEVTRIEFLEFMLVAMNQVDKSLLDHLHEHFDRLDKDKSGTIDKDDLATRAKHRIMNSKEKNSVLAGSFRLAHYKDYQQSDATSPANAAMTRRPTQLASNRTSRIPPLPKDTKRTKSRPPSYQTTID